MIGIFDSGSGGLSVLRALCAVAPHADVVYFGDLANAPYGNKSREELGALTVLGIEKLVTEGATEIISACNSVSVSIVLPMFDILDLPRANIIEMVGPTVKHFRDTEARVLVVATRATVASGVYQNGLRLIGVENTAVAIPGLVARIEQGANDAAVRADILQVLEPHRYTPYTHILLGCTHYPLVLPVFAEVLQELGMTATLYDPAHAVAESARLRFDTNGKGTTRFILSKRSDVFVARADTDENGARRSFEWIE